MKNKLRRWFYSILFRIIRKIVHKYFSDNLTSIMGSGGYKWPIAWTWTFEDENYEKYKKRRKIY